MNKHRFYDRDVNVSRAVQLLLLLPFEMQTIIADGISSIAEQEFRANKLMREIKTLGTEKVLALYKSKQRKRDYDKNPAVHKAINYLLVLSDENRAWIALRIIGLIGCLQDYLRTCRTYAELPHREAVDSLTSIYVECGPDQVKVYLKTIEAEFKTYGTRKRALLPGEHLEEFIRNDRIGLRLRNDNP